MLAIFKEKIEGKLNQKLYFNIMNSTEILLSDEGMATLQHGKGLEFIEI